MSSEVARSRLTRAQSRARTRELLIASAMRVFARAGYAGASVDAIAEEAGFSVGAVYSNFATKDELFWAAFERHCAEDLASLKALAEASLSRRDLLDGIGARLAVVDEQRREWWQLWAELWLHALRHPAAGARFRAVQDETRSVITRLFTAGGRRPDDELVSVIHALWWGFMMYRVINPDAIGSGAFGHGVEWLISGQAATRNKTQPRIEIDSMLTPSDGKDDRT